MTRNRPINAFIYLGSGEEGEALEKAASTEAKSMGFVKGNRILFSPYAVHCIKEDLRRKGRLPKILETK